MHNTFGKLLQLTTFGESHGIAVGGILDGFPSDFEIDFEFINHEIYRRRTAKDLFESSRNEEDKVQFLSGIFDGKTLGTPIAFVVYNKDARSDDYEKLKNIYRPSHADYTTQMKYGIRDYRGGGRASAREALSWVIAGAFAKMLLKQYNINITAFVSQIGTIAIEKDYKKLNFASIKTSKLFCPDKLTEGKMHKLLVKIKEEGDTTGGKVSCVVQNCPIGLGEPVFNKLQAQLAEAMLNINAVKAFEYGSGFSAIEMKGTEHNDSFINVKNQISTVTNHSGGIQGGISNGEDIFFNVAFKPISSINKEQHTVDMSGNKMNFTNKGRNDVCALPRAVPIVEALTALVLADNLLMNKR